MAEIVREDLLEDLELAARHAGIDLPEIVAPVDRFTTLQDLRFHYLDWGIEGRPATVFCHGGGLTAHTWDLVCLGLRTDHHCFALDLRGHGDSDHSEDLSYGMDAHAGDIAAFADHLGTDGYVLVGMSLGALASMVHAAGNPDGLRGLVLVDAGPELRREGASRVTDFLAATPSFASLEEAVEKAAEFNPRRDPRLLRRSLLHNLKEDGAGRWVWKYDRRLFEMARSSDMSEHLENLRRGLWAAVEAIRCPTLVVRGADSDVLTPEAAAELASRLDDASVVEIPGAGHTVQGDNPAGFVDAVRPFLGRVTGA